MKKFFKKTEGFTLVELIVVIAILGILAGVGTVGYSGYIKKANEAADNQLVAAVNQAFAAACLENGVDATTTTAAGIAIGSDKKVSETDIVVSNPAAKAAAIKAAFGKYIAGNENSEFKVATSLTFTNGMFVANFGEAGPVGGFYADLFAAIKNSAEQEDNIEALGDSTFGGTMGVSKLMEQVADVTNIAAGMAGVGGNAGVQNVLDSTGFHPGMSEEDAIAQVKANAAVLYTAQQSAGLTTEQATNLFTSATSAGILQKMMSDDSAVSGEGMAQAALVCGMYTAYVNREGSTVTDKTVDVGHVLTALSTDDDFNNYLTTDQGKKDLEGYLGSLKILSSTANGENTDEVEKLMVNGFNDPDLVAGIGSLLG